MNFVHHKKLRLLLFIGLLLNVEAHLIHSKEDLESENEVFSEDESTQVKHKFTITPIVKEQNQYTDSEIETIYDGVNFESKGNAISGNENQANVNESELHTESAVIGIQSAIHSNQSLSDHINDTDHNDDIVSVEIVASTDIPETSVGIENVTSIIDSTAQESLIQSTATEVFSTQTPSFNEQVTESIDAEDSTENSTENLIDSAEHSNNDEIANNLIEIIQQQEAGIDATFERFIKHLRCLVLVENTDFLQLRSLPNEVFVAKPKSKFLSVSSRDQKSVSSAKNENNSDSKKKEATLVEENKEISSSEIDYSTSSNESNDELLVEDSSDSVAETKNDEVSKDAKIENATPTKDEKISTSTSVPSREIPSDMNSITNLSFPSPGLYWKPLNFALFNQSQVLAGFAIFVLPSNASSFTIFENSSLPSSASSVLPILPAPLASPDLPKLTAPVAAPALPELTAPLASPVLPDLPAPLEPLYFNTPPPQAVTARPGWSPNNFFSRFNFTGQFFNRRQQNRNRLQQQQQQQPQQQIQFRRLPWRGPIQGDVKKIALQMPKSNSQNDYYQQMVGVYNNFWVTLFGNQ